MRLRVCTRNLLGLFPRPTRLLSPLSLSHFSSNQKGSVSAPLPQNPKTYTKEQRLAHSLGGDVQEFFKLLPKVFSPYNLSPTAPPTSQTPAFHKGGEHYEIMKKFLLEWAERCPLVIEGPMYWQTLTMVYAYAHDLDNAIAAGEKAVAIAKAGSSPFSPVHDGIPDFEPILNAYKSLQTNPSSAGKHTVAAQDLKRIEPLYLEGKYDEVIKLTNNWKTNPEFQYALKNSNFYVVFRYRMLAFAKLKQYQRIVDFVEAVGDIQYFHLDISAELARAFQMTGNFGESLRLLNMYVEMLETKSSRMDIPVRSQASLYFLHASVHRARALQKWNPGNFNPPALVSTNLAASYQLPSKRDWVTPEVLNDLRIAKASFEKGERISPTTVEGQDCNFYGWDTKQVLSLMESLAQA